MRGNSLEIRISEAKLNIDYSFFLLSLQIFLILWFWYGFLTIFGVTRLIYRMVQCSSRRLRYFIIKIHTHRYFHTHGHTRHVEHYIKKCSFGDWFVLYQMSRNMNRRFFAEFLTLLSRRVNPDPEIIDEEEEEEMENCMPPLPTREISNLSINQLNNPEKKNLLKPVPGYFRTKRNASMISLHSKVFDLTFDNWMNKNCAFSHGDRIFIVEVVTLRIGNWRMTG